MKTESLSLSQLNRKIKSAIQSGFTEPIWVVAEISELRINSSGHCYMEFIEKAEESDQILAKIKATIWSFTFRMLGPYFETTTGYRLAAGLKVMVRVLPEFHEVYGINLVIKDIDPSYTLGDLARIKREIIRRLQSEGVIDMNRMLEMPPVPQRIAVISSETAAGYGDFMHSLGNNPEGYHFHCELFSALMQGDKAAESIIHSLDRIYERENQFDVVVIIRGGGAQSDLECFNNYDLAYHITQFPLPILSGIGHERDETIADLVAHTSLKTPTAVAGFLIDALGEFDEMLNTWQEEVVSIVTERILGEKQKINLLAQNSFLLVQERMADENNRLFVASGKLALSSRQFFIRNTDKLLNHQKRLTINYLAQLKLSYAKQEFYSGRLNRDSATFLNSQKEKLVAFSKNLGYLSPENVLSRGYSLSSANGKIIKDSSELTEGDELTTKFHHGRAISVVKKLKNP